MFRFSLSHHTQAEKAKAIEAFFDAAQVTQAIFSTTPNLSEALKNQHKLTLTTAFRQALSASPTQEQKATIYLHMSTVLREGGWHKEAQDQANNAKNVWFVLDPILTGQIYFQLMVAYLDDPQYKPDGSPPIRKISEYAAKAVESFRECHLTTGAYHNWLKMADYYLWHYQQMEGQKTIDSAHAFLNQIPRHARIVASEVSVKYWNTYANLAEINKKPAVAESARAQAETFKRVLQSSNSTARNDNNADLAGPSRGYVVAVHNDFPTYDDDSPIMRPAPTNNTATNGPFRTKNGKGKAT